MKKKLIVLLSFATVLLTWCNNSNINEIDPNTWTSKEGLSVEKVYNQQIDESQYIKDLEDFLSYNILLMTEDKPFISDMSLTANFSEKSSVKWWVSFSQNKYSKAHDLEDMEIAFDVRTEQPQNDLEPFCASWNLSIVYQNDELYASIHNFWVYMWEWDMLAKMYTLLWETLANQRIDLEAHSWWIVTLNEKEDIKLQYILWTLKNVLKSEWINEDSPNFLNGVAELVDTINSRIDLWIFTNELTLLTKETKYFQLSDWSIKRDFIWLFQWDKSEFSLSLTSKKSWLEVHLYDIKEFSEDTQSYLPTDVELIFSIEEKENKTSEYWVEIELLKAKKSIVDIDWTLKYNNQVDFNGNFVLNSSELIEWEKILWSIELRIIKGSPNGDEVFPEVSTETILLSNIMASL